MTLDPVQVVLGDLTLSVQTVVEFGSGGVIVYRRRVLPSSDTEREGRAGRDARAVAPLTITERAKVAPGITEYPQDMHGIRLAVHGQASGRLEYEYKGRSFVPAGAQAVAAEFPSISTRLSLEPLDRQAREGCAAEGHLYSPYVTLTLSREIVPGEETAVCLKVERKQLPSGARSASSGRWTSCSSTTSPSTTA